MKKIYVILVSLVLFFTSMQAQWNQNFTMQSTLIDEVSVASDQVVWITDQAATQFSLTTNGGISWITKSFPTELTTNNIGALSAVNATTAYTVVSQGSAQGIYKTINSGDTWVKQNTGFASPNSFPDCVYFWNENEGIAIGDGNSNLNLEIYTTSNGGDLWTLVPATSFPTTANDYTFNSNTSIKVHGNTLYVLTVSGKILKSVNKGLNWTVITTPFTDNSNATMSFDFVDDTTGLVSNFNSLTGITELYSTQDGGQHWVSGTSTNVYPNLKYIPSEKAWFSMHLNKGFTYSLDNGVTWTKHPSFQNMGMKTAEVTPSGKIFMGGWQFMYYSTNFKGTNPALQQLVIKDETHLDLYFDREIEPYSGQNYGNYTILYKMKPDNSTVNTDFFIGVQSATLDATDKSLIRLVTLTGLPKDTITLFVNNVMDLNGFPVITGSIGAVSSLIYTSAKQVYGSGIRVVLNNAGTELNVSGVTGDAVFNLFDVNGRMILSRKTNGTSTIPVGLLPTGIFLVKLTTAEGTVERKILKN